MPRLSVCNGVPQVAFKGYEEARVALTCLLFTIPCCIIIGVEYGVFMNGKLMTKLKASSASPGSVGCIDAPCGPSCDQSRAVCACGLRSYGCSVRQPQAMGVQ